MKKLRPIHENEIDGGYVKTKLKNGEKLYRCFLVNGEVKAAYTAAHEFEGEFDSTLRLVAYENGVEPDDVDVSLMYG